MGSIKFMSWISLIKSIRIDLALVRARAIRNKCDKMYECTILLSFMVLKAVEEEEDGDLIEKTCRE